MTQADLERLKEQLKADYENSSFEVEDYDTIPDLEELPQGKAARVRDVAHLFFDIRGFTSWADAKRDATVFKVLDPTFRLLTRVARYYNGFIEKHTGDGLHVVLGAEEPKPELVGLTALQCAQDMGITMDEIVSPFMKSRKHIEELFGWGIGIEMGHTLIAKMGIRNHFHFNSISKAANYASKFQDAARSGEILVGERLYEHLPEEVQDELGYWGGVEDREVYVLKPRRDESGNWLNLLALGLGTLGIAVIVKKLYDSWSEGQALGVTPQGALTQQGGTPLKPHRWYGEEST
jgi:class 3 adenylate cyclase